MRYMNTRSTCLHSSSTGFLKQRLGLALSVQGRSHRCQPLRLRGTSLLHGHVADWRGG